MTGGADIRRVHFINSLFARLTGNDLYLARQISEAIAFSLAELEAQTLARPEAAAPLDGPFVAAAASLLERFYRDQPEHGFFHWDAARTLVSATPLFARAELIAGLKSLSGCRTATLLVTNLRPAFIPPDARATPGRQRAYAEALAFIRDLAAARTAPSAHLELLFL